MTFVNVQGFTSGRNKHKSFKKVPNDVKMQFVTVAKAPITTTLRIGCSRNLCLKVPAL